MPPARFSKTIPEKLAEQYQSGLDDPEGISVRDHIALLDSRITELLARVEIGLPAGWTEVDALVTEAIRSFREYKGRGPTTTPQAKRLEAILSKLRDITRTGRIEKPIEDDTRVWREIRATIQDVRKAADTEQKRVISSQTQLSGRQARGFAETIARSVKTHVKDPAVLRAIQADIRRFAGWAAVDGEAAADPLALPSGPIDGSEPTPPAHRPRRKASSSVRG